MYVLHSDKMPFKGKTDEEEHRDWGTVAQRPSFVHVRNRRGVTPASTHERFGLYRPDLRNL